MTESTGQSNRRRLNLLEQPGVAITLGANGVFQNIETFAEWTLVDDNKREIIVRDLRRNMGFVDGNGNLPKLWTLMLVESLTQ